MDKNSLSDATSTYTIFQVRFTYRTRLCSIQTRRSLCRRLINWKTFAKTHAKTTKIFQPSPEDSHFVLLVKSSASNRLQSLKMMPQQMYRRRDSNPYSHHWPREFKSLVSTSSTTPAEKLYSPYSRNCCTISICVLDCSLFF